jgi:hypothetical protein
MEHLPRPLGFVAQSSLGLVGLHLFTTASYKLHENSTGMGEKLTLLPSIILSERQPLLIATHI